MFCKKVCKDTANFRYNQMFNKKCAKVMSKYANYGILSTVRLTQLHETVCQLKSIKYPTGVIKELIEHLEWIEKDFPKTIELLNNEGKMYNKIYESHNTKNLQLHIDFV